MRNSRFGKLLVVVLGAGALLAGCGGAPEEQQDGVVKAQGEACNPDTSCTVSSPYVQCNDGLYMYAHQTDDGWCIERNVCDRHGGAIICPFY